MFEKVMIGLCIFVIVYAIYKDFNMMIGKDDERGQKRSD